MKNILKQFFIFLLCAVFVSNACISTVYASDDDREGGGHRPPTQEEKEAMEEEMYAKLGISKEGPNPDWRNEKTIGLVISYILTQGGAITGGDFSQLLENDEAFREEIGKLWNKDNVKVQFSTDSMKPNVVFSKTLSDQVLKMMKDATKGTNNGGYELVKTVPISRLSSLYFQTPEQYATLLNLLNDNNGIIAYRNAYVGNKSSYYKVDYSCLFVKGDPYSYSVNGVVRKFDTVILYKNLNAGSRVHYAYILNDDSAAAKKWDDTDNLKYLDNNFNYNVATLNSYDFFSALVNDYKNSNPLGVGPFLITKTGASIPVFNTIDDAVNYSVKGNLYYTTSDFTGEGKEITIDPDELDKILGGYYSGLYDLLQKLIDQNGGNTLTPEQLQDLADQVVKAIKEGFDDLGAETEETNNILLAIRSVVGKGFDSVNEKLDELIKQIKKLKNWTALGTVFEGLDFIMDLADFVKDFFDDVTVGVGFLSYGLKDVINLAKQKFPFSIPWDIAFLIAFLADTPEVPVFELPFELKSYGISEKLVIDFSHFSSISKISRMFLTMIYIVGLLNLTNKIIANKKGA